MDDDGETGEAPVVEFGPEPALKGLLGSAWPLAPGGLRSESDFDALDEEGQVGHIGMKHRRMRFDDDRGYSRRPTKKRSR